MAEGNECVYVGRVFPDRRGEVVTVLGTESTGRLKIHRVAFPNGEIRSVGDAALVRPPERSAAATTKMQDKFL